MVNLTKRNWQEYALPATAAGIWGFRVPIGARWEASEIAKAVFYIPMVITSRVTVEDGPGGSFVMFTARRLGGLEQETFTAGSWAPVDVIKGTVADVVEDVRAGLAPGGIVRNLATLGVGGGIVYIVYRFWR